MAFLNRYFVYNFVVTYYFASLINHMINVKPSNE